MADVSIGRFVCRLARTALAAAMFISAALQSALAQPVADFYRGKRLTLISSSAVGGGYDQYARLLAKHMGRHIPGEPSIAVQNMVGAEGIRAANYLYAVAAQDGSVFGGVSRNIGLVSLYEPGNSALQFDARKLFWLGSPQQEVGLAIVAARSGLRTLDDLRQREVTASSTARNAPTSVYPRLLNALHGTRIKVIEGYDGSPAALMAFERGEVEAYVSGGLSAATLARIEPWLKNGSARAFLQMGMTRGAAFPDVPTAIEAMATSDHKRVFEIAFTDQVMGRPFVLPPGVPAERIRALRAAFDTTMRDESFLAEAKAQKMDIDPIGGEAINALLDRVYSSPPAVIERLRELVK
jgi:tripartite-type tricarboxylate transporter receptor subunit TctC